MHKKIIYLLFAFFLFGFVNDYGNLVEASTEKSSTTKDKKETENDVYIIEFKTTDKNKNKEKIIKENGKLRTVFKKFNYISANLNEKDVEKLKKDKDIKRIIKNDNIKVILDEDSSELTTESLAKTEINWGYNALNINETYTGNGIKIGILDSGIKTHDEYQITGGADCYTQSETLCNWDYKDDYGHGTFIAGVTSSNRNDGEVKGVAPNSQLYAIKFYEPILDGDGKLISGNMKPENFIRAVEWAIEKDIDVLNMSFSLGEDSNEFLPILNELINTAVESQMYIVAAAGNGEELDHFPRNHPLVTVVSATYKNKFDDTIHFVEEFTKGKFIDISAPGYKIYSTGLNIFNLTDLERTKKYRYSDGTSYAAPFVTGTVALAKQQFPNYDNDDIFALLMLNTKQVINHDSVWDEKVGYGLLQANFKKTLTKKINQIHLNEETIGREIPNSDARSETVSVGTYFSDTMYKDENGDYWYKISIENQRAKWLNFGDNLIEKTKFRAVLDNSYYSNSMFDADDFSYNIIYNNSSTMYRFVNPIRPSSFDIKYSDSRPNQNVEINFYNGTRQLVKSIPISEDGVYDIDVSGEQIYYFEIKNNSGKSVEISDFDVFGEEISTPESAIDFEKTFISTVSNRKFFSDINSLESGLEKNNLLGKEFIVKKVAKWDDKKENFAWAMVSNEELNIQDMWVELDTSEIEPIYKKDLTSNIYGQVVSDIYNFSPKQLYDDASSSISYLKYEKKNVYEFDKPVDINRMFIKADPTILDNKIKLTFIDENGTEYTEEIGDYHLFLRYFYLQNNYQNIKKVKVENLHSSKQDITVREIGYFGKENSDKTFSAITIHEPVLLKNSYGSKLKLYDTPFGKEYKEEKLTSDIQTTAVRGYGMMPYTGKFQWMRIEYNGELKWVNILDGVLQKGYLYENGTMDKVNGQLTSSGGWILGLNAIKDNSEGNSVMLSKDSTVEYTYDTTVSINQIFMLTTYFVDDYPINLTVEFLDESANVLYQRKISREDLYRKLVQLESTYQGVKKVRIKNETSEMWLREIEFKNNELN